MRKSLFKAVNFLQFSFESRSHIIFDCPFFISSSVLGRFVQNNYICLKVNFFWFCFLVDRDINWKPKTTPLNLDLYSTKAQEFESENRESIKSIDDVIKIIWTIWIWVLDRWYLKIKMNNKRTPRKKSNFHNQSYMNKECN